MTTPANPSSPFVEHAIHFEDSVFTNRNRYASWVALGMLVDEIRMDLDQRLSFKESSAFRDFPTLAGTESVEWWLRVLDIARDLWECMRTGEEVLRLQSPAEHAIAWIVTQMRVPEVSEYLHADDAYSALPESPDDLDHGIVRVGDLFDEIGDLTEIAHLWSGAGRRAVSSIAGGRYMTARWFDANE